MTLNMLRLYRMNPKILAYTALEGEYNYFKNSLTPFSTKVLVFNYPTTRQTWVLIEYMVE